MNWRERLGHWLFTILLLAGAVMAAFLSTRFAWQHDFSFAQRASLSAETVTLLRQLDAPVAMTSYAPRDNELRGAIADVIARYQRIKPDITLSFVDPDADPAATREAGILVNGELIIRYKGRSEQLKVLTERELDNALLRLARARERLVAFLAGDGERKPDGQANADLGSFGALLKAQGVRAIPLILDAGTRIPDNVDLLTIAGPRARLRPEIAKELIDFVERGGNLLWLTEPGVDDGLDALAKTLSVRMLAGVAVDGSACRVRDRRSKFCCYFHLSTKPHHQRFCPDHPVSAGRSAGGGRRHAVAADAAVADQRKVLDRNRADPEAGRYDRDDQLRPCQGRDPGATGFGFCADASCADAGQTRTACGRYRRW